MLRPMPSAIVDTGMYCSSWAPSRYSGWRGPGTLEMITFTGGATRSASRSRAASRIADVATTGDEYCWMSTSASAGTSSNCCLAASIASRQRATRSQRVGDVRRQVDDQAGDPVRPRLLLVAGADRHRHHRPQRAVRQGVVAQQVGAQRAGADRHHDVVERAAGGVLEPLEVARATPSAWRSGGGR